MRSALFLALVALCSLPLACQAAANDIVNGDFEEGLAGYEGHADAVVAVQSPRSGAHCLRVDGTPDRNGFVQQSVTVEAGREYDLSVWNRCSAVPEGADCKAYLNVWAGDKLLASMAPLPRISGTHPWTQQSVRVRMPAGADRASILLQLYRSTGTVWFDGLVFAPVVTEAERSRLARQATGQKQAVAQALALSRTAPVLAPGVRLADTGDGIFLCNERLALSLEGPAGAFGVRNLVDLQARRAFVVPGFDNALFRVELRPRQSYNSSSTVAYSSSAVATACSHKVEVRGADVILHLRWTGVPADGDAAVDAEATVTLRAGGFARWRLNAKSRQSGAALWLVDFPRLPAVGALGDSAPLSDYLAIPMQQGWRWREPRRTIDWGEGWADYPSGGKSMQFEAYCAPAANGVGASGLYLATEDPRSYRKGCLYRARGDAFSYALRNYPPDMGRTESYEMPYPAVMGMFSGDWWDAAQVYRRWALQQPWSAAGPVRERKNIPQWLKANGVWAQGDVPGREFADMTAQVARVSSFRKEMGVPLAFHAYLWQAQPEHDHDYPFLLPPKPGTKQFVESLQAAGTRVIPYLNIYSADASGPRFGPEGLARLAMRTASGDVYGDPKRLVSMCPATARWQRIMADLFAGVLDALPVDGLYLDQLTGAPFLCFDETHGHPVGGGDHFAQGMRSICKIAKAALAAKRPEGMTFGENISEACNDVIDAQLPWSEVQLDRLLPLYQAVYADYGIRFGLFVGRPDTWGDGSGYYSKLAYTFVTGQQPGWLMFGILNEFDSPAYAPQRAYLRDLAACRLAALDFLAYGQFLRPPDLGQPLLPVSWDDWSTPRPGTLPPVLTGAWKAPDGRIGIALANWTAEPRAVVVPVLREWGLKGGLRARTCTAGRWSQPEPVGGDGLRVQLPAHSTMLVELAAR